MRKITYAIIAMVFIVSLVLPVLAMDNSLDYEWQTPQVVMIEPSIVPTPQPTVTPSPYENAVKKMNQDFENINSIEEEMEWFVAYKDIVYKYAKWIEPPETVFNAFSEEEVRLICRTVETETYDQDFISKTHVASVIFNRLKEGGEYGDSITEIITKENQFAYWRTILTKDTILAVMYAYELGDTTNGCVAFRSDKYPQYWYDWELYDVDDCGHGLYKEREEK